MQVVWAPRGDDPVGRVVLPMPPPAAWPVEHDGRGPQEGKPMIDWDRTDWGGHVHEASNGSWTDTERTEDQ